MSSFKTRAFRWLPVMVMLGGLTLHTTTAHAVYVVEDPTSDANATVNMEDTVNNQNIVEKELAGQLSTMETDLITALREFSGQMTVNSHAQIQASSQLQDTIDARQVNMRITDVKVRGEIAAVPGTSICNVITGVVAQRNSGAAVEKWREEIISQQNDYFSGATSNTGARNGLNAAIAQRTQLHCAYNATAYDVAIGMCPSVTQPGEVLPTDTATITPPVGLDESASSVLAPSGLTMDANSQQAANNFLLNALDGHPIGAMPQGSASASNPAGRLQASDNIVSIAQHSVAAYVGSELVAENAPMPGTGGTAGTDASGSSGTTVNPTASTGSAGTTTIAQWAEGTAEQVIGYNSAGNNFPNGVSKAAFDKLRAMSWFFNVDWAASVGTQGESQTLKDLAMINAYAVYQNWQLQQQMKTLNLTLATMLAIMEAKTRGATE